VKDNELFARMKLDMIKAHMEYITLYLYRTQIEQTPIKDSRIKPILMDLYKTWALRTLLDDCGAVFEAGYFAPIANQNMRKALD
jgi:hypothetical protein